MGARSDVVGPTAAGSTRFGPLRAWAGLMLKPRATFGALSQARHAWGWVPVVLMIGVTVLTVWARSYADSQYFFKDQLAYYSQHPESATYAPTQPVFAPMMTLVMRGATELAELSGSWALWAVGLYVVAILAGQRATTFGAMVKLTLWSWVPYIIRGLLQSGYMVIATDPIFNAGLAGLVLDNTPPTMGDYSFVMIPRQTRLWGTALAYVDIYLFWHMACVVAGLGAYSRLSRRQAWIVVTSIALVWMAIRVALDFWQYKY